MTPGMRAQRREHTKERIAECATRLFGERGFDRASIRDIAMSAEVDPALVLHYFGSKRALFREVIGDPVPAVEVDDDPTAFVLDSLVAKLDDHSGPTVAQLRSILTNPDAQEHARTQLGMQANALADRLPGEHPGARAHLLLATSLGVAIARELLKVEALAELSPSEVAAELRPAVQALAGAAPPS